MNAAIESFNEVSCWLLSRLWTVLWQWTLIAVVGAAIILSLRRAQPVVRFWLWQVLLLKLALMPFWIIALERQVDPSADPIRQHATNLQNRGETLPAGRSARPVPVTRDGKEDPVAARPTVAPETADARESRAHDAAILSSWPAWVMCAWLAVISVTIVRVAFLRRRLRQFLSATKPADVEIQRLVEDTSAVIGLKNRPRVVLTKTDISPFVCRCGGPTLVLPGRLTASLETGVLRQVVLHELAHLKRRDLVWGWIPMVLRTLFVVHPLVHWICRRIHLERELACDQIAMAYGDANAGDYARTLIDVLTYATDNEHSSTNMTDTVRLFAVHP